MVAYLKKLTPTVTRFILLQLVLTLFSLPFLIAWGLPVSLLSPIGNFVFSPVITAFLFFSSLFFFTELVHIPNGVIVWCLEQITAMWLYLLSWNKYSWLIGFSKPPVAVLFLIFFCAFGITYHAWIGRPYQSVAALSLLLCISWISLALLYPSQNIQYIPCNRHKQLVLMYQNNQTIIIDPGYLHTQSTSWISYTLPSEIITRTGVSSLDHLILLQLSPRLLQALKTLTLQIPIKNIYIPRWRKKLPAPEYNQLYDYLKNRGTHIIFIEDYPIHIPFCNTNCIVIQSNPHKTSYQSQISSTAHAIITIDTTQTTIYAAKQKNKDKDLNE